MAADETRAVLELTMETFTGTGAVAQAGAWIVSTTTTRSISMRMTLMVA